MGRKKRKAAGEIKKKEAAKNKEEEEEKKRLRCSVRTGIAVSGGATKDEVKFGSRIEGLESSEWSGKWFPGKGCVYFDIGNGYYLSEKHKVRVNFERNEDGYSAEAMGKYLEDTDGMLGTMWKLYWAAKHATPSESGSHQASISIE